MAKGDDAIAKHRNKAIRKRKRRAGADTLEAIQGVQAAKRRRKAGTRRVCEAMCFALPTPDDPFLEKRDRMLKLEKKREAARKAASEEAVTFVDELSYKGKEYRGGEDAGESDDDVTAGYHKLLKRKKGKDDPVGADKPVVHHKRRKVDSNGVGKEKAAVNGQGAHKELSVSDSGDNLTSNSVKATPTSNGHTLEINELEAKVTEELVLAVLSEAGLMSAVVKNRRELKTGSIQAYPLAQQFWEAHRLGVDILASCPVNLENRVLGLVAPLAAHVETQKFKDYVLQRPRALILVVSQEQALRVRRVFRPLKKAVGITSVCLHDGTSLERQIEGLKTQRPDIVVATPDRLCELLSAQALSLSSVSLFVVDELAEMVERGLQSHVSKIKEYVNRGARKVVLSNSYPERAVIIARQLVGDPVARVISQKSLEGLSACITQTVSVFTDVTKRMSKMLKIAQQFWENHGYKGNWTILVVVENEDTVRAVSAELVKIGYKTATLPSTGKQEIDTVVKRIRGGTTLALVSTVDSIGHIPLEKMHLVINYSFPADIEVYRQILTGMARQSVDGGLHTFCTASMASSAAQLVQILKTCFQPVPLALQMLADAASLVQRHREKLVSNSCELGDGQYDEKIGTGGLSILERDAPNKVR